MRHHNTIHIQRFFCFQLKLLSKNYPTYISQNSAFQTQFQTEHFQPALMITTSEKNFITRAISLAFKYFVNITLNIRHTPYQKQASAYTAGEFHYYWNSTVYCTAGWESQTEWLQLSDQQPEQTTAGLIWFRRGHVVAFQTLKPHRVIKHQWWCCPSKDKQKDAAAFPAQTKVAEIFLQEIRCGK